jgi:hypothetical protein
LRKVVIVAAVLAVAAVAAWRLAAPPPPPDEERIRTLFDDAARAAEERRIGDVVAGVSERFQGDGLDRRGLARLVAAHVLRGEWVRVGVAGARVRVEGERATALVDAVLARGGAKGKALVDLLPSEATAHRIACDLAREDGEWRIVAARWRPVSLAEALDGPPEPEPPSR